MDINNLETEQPNHASEHIDSASTEEIVRIINREDHKVAPAVEKVLPQIAQAVDIIYAKIHAGGRLVYSGCGTSGRLGVLDAVECPPTYGVPPEMVVGLMAGGPPAVVKAVEGAEDARELGRTDLMAIGFSAGDALVGIAASGRTPYVLGALEYAVSLGAPAIALTCCRRSEMSRIAQLTINPICGPEVVTGSTRMKSGTAQKMVLNMLSTAVMIKMGKVYGNLMVDVKATNEKLVQRSITIVRQSTDATEEQARDALARCGGSCKTAIVMLLCGLSPEAAEAALAKADGHIARVLKL
jgi:N-acetylmuramic acid 6-phosphate etherase